MFLYEQRQVSKFILPALGYYSTNLAWKQVSIHFNKLLALTSAMPTVKFFLSVSSLDELLN